MGNLITPLFARLRKKYTRFPASCGVWLDEAQAAYWFVRARGPVFLTAVFSSQRDLVRQLIQPYRPDVVCVSAGTDYDRDIVLSQLSELENEGLRIICSRDGLLRKAFGMDDPEKNAQVWLLENGIELRPGPSEKSAIAALAALAGLFFLNDEYTYIPGTRWVLPLLTEIHPLYMLLWQVPFGEVITCADAAKALGLQWTEQAIMAELARLPAGSDVPCHRMVNRDGSLSKYFPGGSAVQKERLKWEMVPLGEGNKVILSQALWKKQKYRPLTNYLRHATANVRFVELHFDEIERILDVPLPRAARRLGNWWDNDRPYSTIWTDAGCRVARVNMQMQRITFTRSEQKQ